MGTDIHAVAQAFDGSRWRDVPFDEWDQDRHYELFAWLGNVRNGFGFAGIPIFDPIVPLSDNRGFPEDFEIVDDDTHPTNLASINARRREWLEESDRLDDGRYAVWMGEHSYSWLAGEEILANKQPEIHQQGVVSLETYVLFRDTGEPPKSWSGSISGSGVVISTPQEITKKTTHVRLRWQRPAALDYFVEAFQALADRHDQVRLVFGFDS